MPAITGVPAGIPVAAAAASPDRADDLAGPHQPRQRQVSADPLCPFGIPIEVPCGIQRVALAGRVVIHHVLAGELGRDEGVRPVPVRRLGEDFRFVSPHPFQLRTRRPGSTAPCPPAREWRRHPIPLSASRSRRTRECRSPYRMAGRSGRRASSHSTRHGPTPLTHIAATVEPGGTCAVSFLLMSQTSRHHVFSASTSAQPGRGNCIEWRHRLGGHDCTGRVDEKPLRAPGPHVDPEQQLHEANDKA